MGGFLGWIYELQSNKVKCKRFQHLVFGTCLMILAIILFVEARNIANTSGEYQKATCKITTPGTQAKACTYPCASGTCTSEFFDYKATVSSCLSELTFETECGSQDKESNLFKPDETVTCWIACHKNRWSPSNPSQPHSTTVYWAIGATSLLLSLFFVVRELWRMKNPTHSSQRVANSDDNFESGAV
mmetsp:Transcript_6083/g.11516  ORF Transcript_6083/g.11516 Transcript_6083/m.11516 type:complete len:187 (+) Transcript_6083:29-589(+)|eukprot:CAMPEP_0175098820 /NCGR_PEP_ID=MMETSP0086_2-20121207/6084_1 /TAXON_ID=136419 /ORGANISM="Unknown Unknown, Strain D1" /LENGTH=186 /DNA_ID=CAMNT_0016372543 /DNA_START=24 /DNA_END=584 /DNA_ORIENTATION=-